MVGAKVLPVHEYAKLKAAQRPIFSGLRFLNEPEYPKKIMDEGVD